MLLAAVCARFLFSSLRLLLFSSSPLHFFLDLLASRFFAAKKTDSLRARKALLLPRSCFPHLRPCHHRVPRSLFPSSSFCSFRSFSLGINILFDFLLGLFSRSRKRHRSLFLVPLFITRYKSRSDRRIPPSPIASVSFFVKRRFHFRPPSIPARPPSDADNWPR